MSAPSKKRARDTDEASSPAGPREKRQKIPNFTELVEIYGHPIFNESNTIHSPLEGIIPLKSGLTPLDLGPFATAAELSLFQKLEAYQRTRFKGELSSNATYYKVSTIANANKFLFQNLPPMNYKTLNHSRQHQA
jgi:hypothetical protein